MTKKIKSLKHIKLIQIFISDLLHPIITRIIISCLFISAIYGQGDMFIFGNNRPVADAGRDIKTISMGSIFLDGSRSFVGDGSKIKYHWIFAPGLALKSDNDFSSEISFDTYGSKYLKSVETYKQVLDLKLSENEPGTKLEVILKIKDRIGFEDFDTLIVEYFDPNIKKNDGVAKSTVVNNTVVNDYNSVPPVSSQDPGSGILIQGLADSRIDKVDSQIINSIIMDQIKSVGFNYMVYLEKNMKKNKKKGSANSGCKTEACVSKNAMSIGTEYFITWQFANSIDELYLKIYDSKNFKNHLNEEIVLNPYRMMNSSGIHGIDKVLRKAVSKLMSGKHFKNEISTFDRLFMNNEQYISYGKYPLFLGMTYLLFDKILYKEPQESKPKMPPGFPHDS